MFAAGVLTTALTTALLQSPLIAAGTIVTAGAISTDTTWSAADSPIDVTGVVVVASGASLTIEPGVVVQLASGAALQIDGALVARGTEAQPIRFTSTQSAVAPGQWGFVLFTDGAADAGYDAGGQYLSGSILEHVVIEGAGGAVAGSTGAPAALRLINASPFVGHARIENNRGAGVAITASTAPAPAPRIVDSAIEANDEGIAAQLSGVAGSLRVERTSVARNRGRGVTLLDSLGASTLLNNVIEDNRGEGIAVYSNRGALRIEGNTIRRNDRGVYVVNFATLVSVRLINNLVQANAPQGGIWIEDSSYQSNVTEVRNNRILQNSAAGAAAALTFRTLGPATIAGNVIAENTSASRAIVSAAALNNQTTMTHNVMVRNQAPRIVEGTLVPAGTAFPAPALFENTIVDNRPTSASQSAIHLTYTAGRPWTATANNVDNPQFAYELRHSLPAASPAMDALNNWWGSADPVLVRTRIYDQFFSATLGAIAFDPALGSASLTAPLSPPRAVTVTPLPEGLRLDWLPSAESDVAGYRISYDTHPGPDYAHSVDVGAATSYTLTGMPAGTYYLAVSAYDADADGVDDLFDGNQSWYSVEALAVSAPEVRDPIITWTPASLVYGDPLGAAQLNAAADVPGTFTYSPAVGTVLDAGSGQALQLTFTPADTAAYREVSTSVTIDVAKAPLLLTKISGQVSRGYYDPPGVSLFDAVTGFKGSDSFDVVIVDLPGGTPPGDYRPLQVAVANDAAQRAANYVLTLQDPNYFYRVDYPAILDAEVLPHGAAKATGPIALTITGHDFVPAGGAATGTVVSWNGAALPVTFISRTALSVSIPVALLANAGVAQIAIENPGAPGTVVTPFFITDVPTTVTNAVTGTAVNGSVTIATPSQGGQPPLVQATAGGGEGSVSVATYASNPSSVFTAADAFFDVFVASGSAFNALTLTVCPPNSPSQILWFNGAAWVPASNQAASGSCVVVTVDATTSPSLAQLTGTYFAASRVTTPRPDRRPPVVTAHADRDTLWPANGKLVKVTIKGRAHDRKSGVASLRYRINDEYGQVEPSGTVQLDGRGRYKFVVWLPAERRGNDKNGRRFTIKVTATDHAGNTATAKVEIVVPHDRHK